MCFWHLEPRIAIGVTENGSGEYLPATRQAKTINCTMCFWHLEPRITIGVTENGWAEICRQPARNQIGNKMDPFLQPLEPFIGS